MFDELKKPPEDMFASVDETNVPPPFRTQPSTDGPAVPPIQPIVPTATTPAIISGSVPSLAGGQKPTKAIAWKPIVLIVLGVVVVIAIGALLSKYILSSSKPVTSEVSGLANTVSNQASPTTTNKPESPAPVVAPVTEPVTEPVVEVDTDKDGLIDTKETELGTNPTKVDTDDDGLFDREEVEVYHTNPLSPDTDGDTYLDGAEVKSGYNPNGAGKLFELPVTEGR